MVVGTPTWKAGMRFLLHKCLHRAEKPHQLQLACFCPRMLSKQRARGSLLERGRCWLKPFWVERFSAASRKIRPTTVYWRKKKKKKGMATSPPPANNMQLLTTFSSKLTMKNKNKQKKKTEPLSLSEHDPRPSVDFSCQWLLHMSYQVAPGRTESCSLPLATCPWSGTSVPW